MRIKRTWFCMLLIFSLTGGAKALLAQELEALFDDASKSGTEVKPPANAVSDALVVALKSLLMNPNPEQSLFLRHIESKSWGKALLQYQPAFEGTPFQKSANGRALYGLAHVLAGLPTTGLEYLFKYVNRSEEIHPEIRHQWTVALPAAHVVWDVAQVTWQDSFYGMFGPESAFKVMTRNLSQIRDVKKLQELANRLPPTSLERARVGWQMVVLDAMADQVEAAAKSLAQLLKGNVLPVSRDLMELTVARLLFQRAHYSAAIKYYERVGRDSEYWPDAQEEMAWSFIRKGEPQNALGISQSLVAPLLNSQVGPESFFVHALAQLKICDYPAVIETLSEYGKRYKVKSSKLEKIAANTSASPEVERLINQLKQGRISRQQLKKDGQELPRLVARDEQLFINIQAQKLLDAEAEAADVVYTQSMALTGLQGYFDQVRNTAGARAKTARSAALNRVRDLARQENLEIKEILRKLHIVEAEVIQQTSLADRVAAKTRGPATVQVGITGSKAKDVLKFTANKEIWFDEVGHFRVQVKKACHAKGPNTGKSI